MPVETPVRVIFHAGFHKTGTTSLQHALGAHRAALAPFYLVETRALSPRLTAAAEAARAYSAAPAPALLAALSGKLADWANAITLKPGQGLVVSSEDFAGHMPANRGISDYAAAVPVAAAVVAAVRDRFAGCELTLLYTTRNADNWLRSIHWQLARHPDIEMTAGKFARKFAHAADFGAVIEAIRKADPGLDVVERPLETLTSTPLGPVEAIYDLAGLPDDLRASLPPVPAANQSPPYDLSGAFVALNREALPRPVLKRLKLALLAAAELDRGTGD